jgi:hypothetical protein
MLAYEVNKHQKLYSVSTYAGKEELMEKTDKRISHILP